MAITLFSTRFILQALGETDFGIYNLIAGVVSMFAFIANTMATTTQRFISFTMGTKCDNECVSEVFYGSLFLHIAIAFIVAVIAQIGGELLIDNVLTIPGDKISAAKFVMWCVSIGLVGTIITVPFDSVLMAHENIILVSVTQIFNAAVRFFGIIFLLYFDVDRLRIYSLIMAALPFINLIVESSYCYRYYQEVRTKFRPFWNYNLYKSILGFASWVMIGTTCGTIRSQGISILLNMFWGVIVNAANGIAVQVNGVMQTFASSITTSIRPQLVKSAGEQNYQRMTTLTYVACKFPFLLTTLIAIPLIIAMPYVLQLWLKEVPQYTIVFCRLLLVSTMFNQLTIGMTVALEAYGKVRLIHTIAGMTFLLVLPISYILLRNGFAPQSVMWCLVVNEGLVSVLRVLIAKLQIGISIQRFLYEVLIKSLYVAIPATAVAFFVWNFLSPGLFSLVIMIIMTIITFCFLVFTVGINKSERTRVILIIQSLRNKFVTMRKYE